MWISFLTMPQFFDKSLEKKSSYRTKVHRLLSHILRFMYLIPLKFEFYAIKEISDWSVPGPKATAEANRGIVFFNGEREKVKGRKEEVTTSPRPRPRPRPVVVVSPRRLYTSSRSRIKIVNCRFIRFINYSLKHRWSITQLHSVSLCTHVGI